MCKSIVLAVVAIFAVIGLTAVLSFILIKAASPDRNMHFCIVLPFGKNDRECALTVSLVLNMLIAVGKLSKAKIIALDCGMEKEEKITLKNSFAREAKVFICDENDIYGKISQSIR